MSLNKVGTKRGIDREGGRIYGDDGEFSALRAHADQNMIMVNDVKRSPIKYPNRNGKQVDGDYAFTIDSVNTGGVSVNSKIRRLTPTECSRLQGFPDDWCDGISDSQKYKCLGNAVTVAIVKLVGEAILKTENL